MAFSEAAISVRGSLRRTSFCTAEPATADSGELSGATATYRIVFGSNPNLAQTGGLLSLLGTDGQQEKQGQSQQGVTPSTTSASAPGSFFGGKREPSFEEQEREYSSIRDQVMKDPGSAALLAGLSILSANRPRNGRTPGLGELVGAGGLGMIQGLGQMQQAQDVRRKQQMDMEMKRAELASKLGPKYEKSETACLGQNLMEPLM